MQVRTVTADPGKDSKLTGREGNEGAVMRAASLCLLDLMGFAESEETENRNPMWNVAYIINNTCFCYFFLLLSGTQGIKLL